MASDNPFLQSPLDALANQTEDDTNRLIGQQRQQAAAEMAQMESVPAPVMPDAPAAPVANKIKTSAPASRKGGDNVLPPDDLRPVFESVAQKYDVPANVIMALAHQESRYNPGAVGTETKWGKAKGMLQYIDSTARGMGIDPHNSAQSIDAAAKQIRERLDKGMSMIDAVKEHFAGPDRKLWGEKTEVYGREVMDTVNKIGELMINGAGKAVEADPDKPVPKGWVKMTPEQVAAYEAKQANNFSTSMPRAQYEATFKANNPNANPAALEQAMGQYDLQAEKRLEQKSTSVNDKFAMAASSEAVFDAKLNKRLAGKKNGVVPDLPGKLEPLTELTYDGHAAERETQLEAAGSFLRKSLKAGGYDLAGAGATVLDAINPFTLSPGDAATLFKDKPEQLKKFQDESAAMALSRFAKAMSKHSEETMEEISARAKRDYGDLKYMTADVEKAAYASPTKVIGDALKSLPSTLAMAVSAYFTRGAALRAEQSALAAGLSPALARQAAIAAGSRAMATVGAASEGTVGYGQQLNQTTAQLEKMSDGDIAKSPLYQGLIDQGFSHEAARAKLIADTAEQSGQIAGIVDAAVNRVGGEFLGKIMTEGGKFLPRVFKGIANESATEFVQSAGEQAGENLAIRQNIDSNQELSKGVGEAALAGAAVGGLMGGATAGAVGRGADPSAPVQEAPVADQQQIVPDAEPAPVEQALPSAPAPTPSQAGGPLARATENAAAQGEQQDQRVTVATPAGNMGGTLQGYQEDADGNFTAEIIDDDGEVHQVSSLDGVQIVPEAPAPSGPISASLSNAAEQHDANPAPAPVVPEPPPAPPGPPDYNAMPIDALRERMKYITQQAKASGGMDKVMTTDKRAVEKAINAKIKEAKEATVLSEEALSPGPFDERVPANRMALRMAEKTGQPHEVIETDGKFTVQPIQEASDGDVSTNANPGEGDVGGRGDRVPDGLEPAVGDGNVSDGSVPGGRGNERSADGTGSERDAQGGAGADTPAVSGPELKPAKDAHAGKHFSDSAKAEAYIVKNKLRTTHRVEQTGRVRYEVRPKNAAPKGDAMAKAAERQAKIDAQIATAAANAEARAKQQAKPASEVEVVEVKDNYGRTHRVRKADLDGTADRIPTVRKNGDVVTGEEIPRSIIKEEKVEVQGFTPKDGWRTSTTKAREYAKHLGINTKNKSISALVEQIDATLADTIDNIDVDRIKAAMADPEASAAVMARVEDAIEAQTGKRPNLTAKSKDNPASDIDAAANGQANDLSEQTEVADDQDIDTGADIPKAFFKKVRVPIDVYIEEERVTETVEMSADKALASVREDIINLRKLIACMKG